MTKQVRIALLWLTVAVGYVYHTICEMMPLFAGASIASDELTIEQVPAMATFTSVIAFLVPIIGLLCSCYGKQRWVLIVNLVIAALSFIMSLMHMGGELFASFSWGQATVLPFISIVLALIIIDLWRMMRTKREK